MTFIDWVEIETDVPDKVRQVLDRITEVFSTEENA